MEYLQMNRMSQSLITHLNYIFKEHKLVESNSIKTVLFIVNRNARSAYPAVRISHYPIFTSIAYSERAQVQQMNKALECLRSSDRI